MNGKGPPSYVISHPGSQARSYNDKTPLRGIQGHRKVILGLRAILWKLSEENQLKSPYRASPTHVIYA